MPSMIISLMKLKRSFELNLSTRQDVLKGIGITHVAYGCLMGASNMRLKTCHGAIADSSRARFLIDGKSIPEEAMIFAKT